MPRLDRALQILAQSIVCLLICTSASVLKAGEKYKSGIDEYAIERFPEKPDTKPRKVVILVHGTDGLKIFGPRLRAFAKELERVGYLVVLPNYFGVQDDSPKSGSPNEELQRLADAISWATDQTDADKAHVGLVGYSLGAALSLVYCERNQGTITSLVDYYGPTDTADPRMQGTLDASWKIVKECEKLPPTLILQNQNDRIVPLLKHSKPLIEALRMTKVICDYKDFSGGDEMFAFHPFIDGSKEDLLAKQMTLDWLKKHL